MGELVRLRKEKPLLSVQVLESIIDQIKKDEITDFVVIASHKLKEPTEDGAYETHKYFFGEDSCVKILGLIEYMKMDVCEYIMGRQGAYDKEVDDAKD
jgi:hypothetical protein